MRTNKLKTEIKKPLTQEEVEQRMRLMANLIIDRIFEDKANNKLMFKAESIQTNNNAYKRVIKEQNSI